MNQSSYQFLSEFINSGQYEESAKQAHESWMAAKVKQGWGYGDERDDDNKKNPMLISFDELPNNVKAANSATPYAVANFFRTRIGRSKSVDELKVLFEELLQIQHKELLAELSEYIHSHFIINLIAQGENTKTRKDMVVFEDLDNDTKSWDTHIALEVIQYLLGTMK